MLQFRVEFSPSGERCTQHQCIGHTPRVLVRPAQQFVGQGGQRLEDVEEGGARGVVGMPGEMGEIIFQHAQRCLCL